MPKVHSLRTGEGEGGGEGAGGRRGGEGRGGGGNMVRLLHLLFPFYLLRLCCFQYIAYCVRPYISKVLRTCIKVTPTLHTRAGVRSYTYYGSNR